MISDDRGWGVAAAGHSVPAKVRFSADVSGMYCDLVILFRIDTCVNFCFIYLRVIFEL